MSIYDILRCPCFTEKSEFIQTNHNYFTVKVNTSANKNDIKKAIEKLYNVKIEKIRTMQLKGKIKRKGRTIGKRPDWKKAYVKIREGKISFVEGI